MSGQWLPIETAPKDGTEVLILMDLKAIQASFNARIEGQTMAPPDFTRDLPRLLSEAADWIEPRALAEHTDKTAFACDGWHNDLRWALGEHPSDAFFDDRIDEGKPLDPFWWRSGLRRRAYGDER